MLGVPSQSVPARSKSDRQKRRAAVPCLVRLHSHPATRTYRQLWRQSVSGTAGIHAAGVFTTDWPWQDREPAVAPGPGCRGYVQKITNVNSISRSPGGTSPLAPPMPRTINLTFTGGCRHQQPAEFLAGEMTPRLLPADSYTRRSRMARSHTDRRTFWRSAAKDPPLSGWL